MRMTSVQWLVRELGLEMSEAVETALEIEQEQIEEAFRIGEDNNDSHHYVGRKIHQNGQDYYNKSFKK
jgi:hypothetical protein